MSLRLYALAFLLFASGCARVQKAPAPTVTASAPDLTIEDMEKYLEMFRGGHYDEIVVEVSPKIEALSAGKRANSSPRVFFVRGMARYHLGWFEEAKADLLIAQKAGGDRLISESVLKQTLQKIGNLTPLLPPHRREIRDGERVIFRMHSFATAGEAEIVAELLPDAYRINRQILGEDVEATTILCFDNYEQFFAFDEAYNGKMTGSWYLAVTTGSLVQLSLRDKKGVPHAHDNRARLHESIVHETNHAMINSLMGRTPLPTWFKEGLANCAGAQVNPESKTGHRRRIAPLFQNNGAGLLPKEKLGDRKFFFEQVEVGVALRKIGKRAGAPDPYAQGYGMVKYLLARTSIAQMQSFLRRVRASDDFDGSFAAEFGLTTEQFCESWQAVTKRELGARSLRGFNFPVRDGSVLPSLPKFSRQPSYFNALTEERFTATRENRAN